MALKLGLSFPAATLISAVARAQAGADAVTGAEAAGFITLVRNTVTFTTSPTANFDQFAMIEGTIVASGSGNLIPFFASEVATTVSGVVIKAGANGICWRMSG